ncbi:MAG: hypothetical protein ACYTGC_20190, partial [Planctomycetota bacterium]
MSPTRPTLARSQGGLGGVRRGRGTPLPWLLLPWLAAWLVSLPAHAGTWVHHAAREPVLVELPLEELAVSLDAGRATHHDLTQRHVAEVFAAGASHPGRLITLRCDPGLRYIDLDSATRARLDDRLGNDAFEEYEQLVGRTRARTIARVRAERPALRLAVYGLPIEPAGRGDPASARCANGHLADVLGSLDALVSGRVLMLAGGSGEHAAVLRALPEAMRSARGRPVFYRLNGGWRIAQLGRPAEEQAATGHEANAPSAERLSGVEPLTAVDGPAPPADEVARFVNLPAQIQIGGGLDLQLELLDAAPAPANVVFQVWSDVTGAVVAPVTDDAPPFVYPAAHLDLVPPGSASVQAIVRDASSTPVAVVSRPAVFLAPIAGAGTSTTVLWTEDWEAGDYQRWSSDDYDNGFSDCTRNRITATRSASGSRSHRSRIRCASGGAPHRGYGLLRFEGDAVLPTLHTASTGGIDGAYGVVVSYKSWLKAATDFGDGRWISFFTATDDCSNAWE